MIPLSLPPPTAARKLERACTATGADSINAMAAAASFETATFVGGRHRGKHSLPLSLRIHDDKHFVADAKHLQNPNQHLLHCARQ